MNKRYLPFSLYLILTMVLIACSKETVPAEQPAELPTLAPQLVLPGAAAEPPATALPPAEIPVEVTPTAVTTGLAAANGVPAGLTALFREWADGEAAYSWRAAAAAELLLQVEANGAPLGSWIYALAGSFNTVPDDISWAELQAVWQGDGSSGWQLYLTPEVAGVFLPLWGAAADGVIQLPADELAPAVWGGDNRLAILPFEALNPQWKVLSVSGISPLARGFDPAVYPLTVPIYLAGPQEQAAAFLAAYDGPVTNRDPQKLSRVAMSGVTALVRATAYQMELNGVQYPGTAVAPIFQNADIAHVSNEVSFAADCPYPDPIGGTTFCSRESYFALLEELGIDLVELTGNHLNDWGRENLTATLEMYEAAGMTWFGGGADLAQAAAPALFSHNGNELAFVGCNPVGPAYAWATVEQPGSRPCDEGFYRQITELRDAGNLVIATLQYFEFYHYVATPQQQADFARAAQAGAAAVSGSQGHHAQGFSFVDGAFIHYGLGNLFFDQMDMLGTRQTFVDTYVVYDGRLLAVELWTGLIENWARPREMTAAEREQALRAVFAASDW